ncbi:hypothetical protein [Mesorhizobium sp.]|uniref:hypothetical protein n=1 Tax=Mesorhizobium sp. TaxID=1871066 RepID=UPI00257B396C|nr:hypothetical protein [Mesorhizobium sp.]
MTSYAVREDVTLIFYVEANSKEEAIAKMKERGVRDFDEVDCSPRGLNKVEVEEDDQS